MDEISGLTAKIVDLEEERDNLKAEAERLKDDKDLLTGQLQQSRKHVSDADLKIRELRTELADTAAWLEVLSSTESSEAQQIAKRIRKNLDVADSRNHESGKK